MAVGGIVSRSVIRSDGVMPPGVLLSGKARKTEWCLRPLIKAGRVRVDERWFGSEFQIFGATERLPPWFCIKEHLLTRMKKIGVSTQVHTMEWVQRGRRTVETVAPCEWWYPGSYLEVYSVTNGEPVQLRQNRRDMIKARFLGHNACKGILNKLEAGQVGNRCASE